MKIKSTTYAIDDVDYLNPIIVEKEMSTRNAIREFVQCQSIHIFGRPQCEHILNLIVQVGYDDALMSDCNKKIKYKCK